MTGTATKLKWNKVHGYEHALCAGGLLRISYRYLNFSYGTDTYVRLEVLTRNGWVLLHRVKQTEGDGHSSAPKTVTLMTEEEALQQVKDYADGVTEFKQQLPVRSRVDLLWEECEELKHCRRPGAGLLRVCYLYLNYSYGTTAYACLKVLTRTGWQELAYNQFMFAGEKSRNFSADKAEAEMLKYAEYLYVGDEEPVAAGTCHEVAWRKSGGWRMTTLPNGVRVRLQYDDAPYSYGTSAWVELSFFPQSQDDDDRRQATLHYVKYMFADRDQPNFPVEVAEQRQTEYAQFLFGICGLIA